MKRTCAAVRQQIVPEGQLKLDIGEKNGKEEEIRSNRSALKKREKRICGSGKKKKEPVRDQVTMEMINIVNTRHEKGMTQDQMARAVHVERSTIASYETGRRWIPQDILNAYRSAKERWVCHVQNRKPSASSADD